MNSDAAWQAKRRNIRCGLGARMGLDQPFTRTIQCGALAFPDVLTSLSPPVELGILV